jgi:aldehyde:ferredoxin oxidoreductase
MATGPLTGTEGPTGARYMVATKSPLTGSATCSNSGGHFPTELKKAGIDMIIFQGQEFAGYDPRGEQGMGLAYATSPVWASYMRGDPAYLELLGVPTLVDPLSWEDKPQLVKDWQDVFAVIETPQACVSFSR